MGIPWTEKRKPTSSNTEQARQQGGGTQTRHITIPIKGNYVKREPPVKRLSDMEFRTRLDKGLCFRCNVQYSHGHWCKVRENRELMLFIMNEEENKILAYLGEEIAVLCQVFHI